MNSYIAQLARTARNPDFRRFCQMLSVLKVGDPIPEPDEIAILIGVEPTMAAWFIDTLVEAGAVIDTDPEPLRHAA